MITVGIIGLANHAQRLREALEPIANVTHLYHPTRSINDKRCTQEFDELLGCDGIVIASPNDTHLDYLLRLKDYPGYILCEKPPVVRGIDVPVLEMVGPASDRLMFNFVYRRCIPIQTLLGLLRPGSGFGRLVSMSFTMTHGLAFRDSYADSWRASKIRHPLGVIETLGVHFIDLALLLARSLKGSLRSIHHDSTNVAGTGDSFDTSRISIVTTCGVPFDVFVSYAAPYAFEMTATGTEGIFMLRSGQMSLATPRDSFDDRGLFTTPPITHLGRCGTEAMYDDAVSRSVSHFIRTIEESGSFDRVEYETSIDTSWALSMLNDQGS